MITEVTQLYTQLDEHKRDAQWMNQLVSQLRRDSTNLYDANEIKINKQYILSQQPMDKIKAMFKDKSFLKNNEFKPLGIWSKIYNILVEEITKNAPKIAHRIDHPESQNITIKIKTDTPLTKSESVKPTNRIIGLSMDEQV